MGDVVSYKMKKSIKKKRVRFLVEHHQNDVVTSFQNSTVNTVELMVSLIQ